MCDTPVQEPQQQQQMHQHMAQSMEQQQADLQQQQQQQVPRHLQQQDAGVSNSLPLVPLAAHNAASLLSIRDWTLATRKVRAVPHLTCYESST